MKKLFSLSIVATIVLVISLMPKHAPKVEVKGSDYNVYQPCWVQNLPDTTWYPLCDQQTPVPAKIVTSDKPKGVTDGVWVHRDLVAKYFPQDQITNALLVMSGENGSGEPTRVSKMNRNGTYDYGLFQINTCHLNRVSGDKNKLLGAETNVQVAYQIWSEQGWHPWVAAQKQGIK